MRLLLAPLLLLATSTAMAQEIYSWKDADGVVHHSDSPPPAGQFQTRTIGHSVPPQAAATGNTEADERAKARAEACTRAKSNMNLISINPTVRMDLDGDGNPETLSAEQREAALNQAKAQSELTCKPEAAPKPATRDE